MSLPKLTAQALLVVPLIVGVSLLAGCKNENTADTKNTQVAETQSCSRGATALFAACDDQNATPNETITNSDTLIAGDTVVTTPESGADGDSQSTVVVLDNLIANPQTETDLTTQPIEVAENNNEEPLNNVVTDPQVETTPTAQISPDTLPTPVAEPNYDEVIAQINKFWTNYSAKTIATHRDNYIESIYQSVHTLTMLASH